MKKETKDKNLTAGPDFFKAQKVAVTLGSQKLR